MNITKLAPYSIELRKQCMLNYIEVLTLSTVIIKRNITLYCYCIFNVSAAKHFCAMDKDGIKITKVFRNLLAITDSFMRCDGTTKIRRN